MVLTIRATASAPRAAMPGVITARPVAKFLRSSSFSARMRAVLLSMTDLQIRREFFRRGRCAGSSLLGVRCGSVGFVRPVHQRNGRPMPNNLGQGWVITELQRERIGFAVGHDCFPPAI